MIPITEHEEKKLDTGELIWSRENITFHITGANKPIYGEIDFTTDSDDYYQLEEMTWLNHLISFGIPVPSDYNYKEHCVYSPINAVRWYDTVDPAIVAQYVHARLGKPKRCCIFKFNRKVK